MSSRDDETNWVAIGAGVAVGVGLLALVYKMFFSCGKSGQHEAGAKKPRANYLCLCSKDNKSICKLRIEDVKKKSGDCG